MLPKISQAFSLGYRQIPAPLALWGVQLTPAQHQNAARSMLHGFTRVSVTCYVDPLDQRYLLLGLFAERVFLAQVQGCDDCGHVIRAVER